MRFIKEFFFENIIYMQVQTLHSVNNNREYIHLYTSNVMS